jgi:hypothetical protein
MEGILEWETRDRILDLRFWILDSRYATGDGVIRVAFHEFDGWDIFMVCAGVADNP